MEASMNEKIRWYEDNAPGYPGGSSAGPHFRSEAEYESYCDHVCEEWNDEHPQCMECGERGDHPHNGEMIEDCGGEPVHDQCSDICIKCDQRYPHKLMDWSECGDHLVCKDCDDQEGK
tara:strand:+ start:2965 stop:3318 length:354 start_codon:yes stop_codon:yes gene_type:complete